MAGFYRFAAARDFLFQPCDARLQLMGGEGGDVFPQHDIGQFLARLQIVQIHGFAVSYKGCAR